MDAMNDIQKIRTQIEQHQAEQEQVLRRTMSVPEMRKLLGLKKTESYWLIHRKFFRTETIGGMMRIDLESFEKWYANQVKYRKVVGEVPGKELREKSYSFKEAANILGIHDCDLYDIWKNEKLEYITVDFVRRIPVDIFEKWYADQDVYRKVTHIPTAEELEKDYICLQDAADLLGISREKLAKIARSEEIGRLLDSTICNNKRWITRKSFQLFLNAQNVYYILDDGDEQVTLVGHNPGLDELVELLLPMHLQSLGTGAMLTLLLSISRWAECRAGCATVVACVFPSAKAQE